MEIEENKPLLCSHLIWLYRWFFFLFIFCESIQSNEISIFVLTEEQTTWYGWMFVFMCFSWRKYRQEGAKEIALRVLWFGAHLLLIDREIICIHMCMRSIQRIMTLKIGETLFNESIKCIIWARCILIWNGLVKCAVWGLLWELIANDEGICRFMCHDFEWNVWIRLDYIAWIPLFTYLNIHFNRNQHQKRLVRINNSTVSDQSGAHIETTWTKFHFNQFFFSFRFFSFRLIALGFTCLL